jgi:predicted nucleotidyltransferase component of viral defense system
MLTRDELLSYKTWPNRYQIEKDYLQYIVLLEIFRHSKNGLVFKGGTALQKCFGLDRFSEDLDFTANSLDEIKRVENALISLKRMYNASFTSKESEATTSFIVKMAGPLYEKPQSIQTITIEISKQERTILPPQIIRLVPVYRDLEAQVILVMDKDEILAEKTRALLTRRRPRDLYDIYFLLHKDAKINLDLINRKLEYYNLKFDLESLITRIKDLKDEWYKELSILMRNPPEFQEIADFVLKAFRASA